MSAERVLASLAPFAVALILSSLVLAAFTLDRTGQRRAAAPVIISRSDERAAPIARALARELAPAVTVEDVPAVADPVPDLATPEPTVATTPVPTPAPPPQPTAAPARAPAPVITSSTTDVEQQTLALINASRAAGGLAPLTLDATVTSAARAHSDVESRHGYVYHDGPDGSARSRDAAACGTGWYGENTGKVWQGDVERLHVEFMSEPWAPINHRTNIMDPAFRRVGIGAVQGNDALYLTMVFCR